MRLWLDNKFQPPETDNIVWAPSAGAAILTILTGWDIDIIDTCDCIFDENGINEILMFIKWLESENVLKFYDFNIHFQTLGKNYTKEIVEILNKYNKLVTFKNPPLNMLKTISGDWKGNSPIREEPELFAENNELIIKAQSEE